MDISLFSPSHINEIPSVEWGICFSPSFISLWSCLSQWGKTGNLSLWLSPPHHHHNHHHRRLLLMQSSEGWHSNDAFFKRNCKSPHRATSSWQLNWSGIRMKRLQLLPKLCNVGKGTSAGQSCPTRTKTGPFSTPVKGQKWEVRGLRLGGKHCIENKRTLFSFSCILILRERALCNKKLAVENLVW